MKKSEKLLSQPYLSQKEMMFITSLYNSSEHLSSESQVNIFEREMADYLEVKDAVALHSKATAIHLALILLGIQKGDRVYCSTLSSARSIAPILYQGASPVWIDLEPETWSMSFLALRRTLYLDAIKGTLPKAIMIANHYGQSARWHELALICEYYSVPVIEDASESIGSTYKGRATGTIGKLGVYSFNEDKIMTTFGGGMLVSNDMGLMERSRYLIDSSCNMMFDDGLKILGQDYRMNDFLAVIGRSQLRELSQRIERKRDIYRKYEEGLSDILGVRLTPEPHETMSNRWLTTLTIDSHLTGVSAQQLIQTLNDKQIEARPVRKPLHMHENLKKYPYISHKEMGHTAKRLFKTGICLPSDLSLTDSRQNRVIETIRRTIKMIRRNRAKIKKYEGLTL